MKNPIEHLNKVFDSRIRLGIMSVLIMNNHNFNDLKELIQVTDGNLASHMKTLKKPDIYKWKKDLSEEKQIQPMPLQHPGKKHLSNTWTHWKK